MLLRLVFLFVIFFQQFLLADTTYSQPAGLIKSLNSEHSVNDVAFSEDGKYVLVSSEKPFSLKLYKADDLSLLKQHWMSALFSKADANPSLTDFIFDAPSRQSFIVGFGSANQLWEILYEDNPLPVYNGVMHDYRLGEGLVKYQGQFPLRIIKLASKTDHPITSNYFYPKSGFLFIARANKIEVIQLDARQTIATVVLNEIPNLTSSELKTIMGTPHLSVSFLYKPGVKLINIKTWEIVEENDV